MMVKLFKRFWWVLGVFGALIGAVLRGRNRWADTAAKALDDAAKAHHEAIKAEGELAKEKVKNETDKAVDAVADDSVADLYNEARDKLGPDGDGRHG